MWAIVRDVDAVAEQRMGPDPACCPGWRMKGTKIAMKVGPSLVDKHYEWIFLRYEQGQIFDWLLWHRCIGFGW